MALEPPNLPDQFTWPILRSILEEWFFRFFRLQSLNETGHVILFRGTAAPVGWLLCNGTEYKQVDYPALFKIIGAESTPGNFAVPNATGAVPATGLIWIIKT